MSHPLLPPLALVAGILLCSCATAPKSGSGTTGQPPFPVRPKAQLNLLSDSGVGPDLGRIALLYRRSHLAPASPHGSPAENLVFARPIRSRSEAAADETARARGRMRRELNSGGDPGPGIVLFPIAYGGYVGGSWLHGWLSGMDNAKAQEIKSTLTGAAGEFALGDRLTAWLLTPAAGSSNVVTAPDDWLIPTDRPRPGTLWQRDPNGKLRAVPAPPPPHPLAARNFNTLAIVDVTTYLTGEGRDAFSSVLQLEVHVRLIRTKDWSEAGALRVEYRTTSLPYVDWAASDGQLFREELKEGLRLLEQEIARWAWSSSLPFSRTFPGFMPETNR